MKYIFLLPLLLICLPLVGQHEMRTYYDEEKQILKEVYFVRSDDPGAIEGKYLKYHPNQILATEGAFQNGVKHGLFKQYYENRRTTKNHLLR